MKALGKLFLIGIAMGVTGMSEKAQAQQPEDDRPPVISRDTMGGTAPTPGPATAPTQPADGSRHGLPLEAFAVVPGTRVLVRLEDELSTGDCKNNFKFKARPMEPLEAGSGFYFPSGAETSADLCRWEPAHITGHAKILLGFDRIQNR